MILTELLLSGAIDDLTSGELAEVVSWFVYDSDRPLWSKDTLSDRLKIARRAARALADKVRKVEIRQQLPPSPTINDRFMGVASGWAQGLSLSGLRQRIELAEGDLLMVLNQTIDLCANLNPRSGRSSTIPHSGPLNRPRNCHGSNAAPFANEWIAQRHPCAWQPGSCCAGRWRRAALCHSGRRVFQRRRK